VLVTAGLLWLAAAPAALARPVAEVVGIDDDALRQRVEAVIPQEADPPRNRFEAERRAERAAERILAVLRSEGHYAATVLTETQPEDAASEDDAAAPTAVARVHVDPGPRFTIAAPDIVWDGPVPPDVEARAGAALGLAPGSEGRAVHIVAAEGRALGEVRAAGHADAALLPRTVVVDHAARTVTPTFRMAAGPAARLGPVIMQTAGRTRPDYVRSLAEWRQGDPFEPEKLARLEDNLLETGVYDAVTVTLAPLDAQGLRPVMVTLTPRGTRDLEAELAYSTTDGFGARATLTRYDRFGRADTQTLGVTLSQRDREIDAQITLPHWRRPGRTLTVGADLFQRETDAFDTLGGTLTAGFQRRENARNFYTLGVEAGFARTAEPSLVTPGLQVERDDALLAANAGVVLDRSDRAFDPRQGWRVDAALSPTVISGERTTAWAGLRGQATGYWPATDRTVLAGRLRAASLLGADIEAIPSSRRLFAGGGGSVRGFGFQEVGPRLPDGRPAGGQHLAEASVEVRQGITDTIGVVAFVDAGWVGNDAALARGDTGVGAGLGVRYDLGFAPIRFDIAVPISGNPGGGTPVQVYLSVGQAF
jgi:translocation and assembly module TamA